MSYKICPNCGSEIEPGCEICPNCGTGVADAKIISDDAPLEEITVEADDYQDPYGNGYGQMPYNGNYGTDPYPVQDNGGYPQPPQPSGNVPPATPPGNQNKNNGKKANAAIIAIVFAIVAVVAIVFGVLVAKGFIGGNDNEPSSDTTQSTTASTTESTTASTTAATQPQTTTTTTTTTAANMATEQITTGAPCKYTITLTLPECIDYDGEFETDSIVVYVNDEEINREDNVDLDGSTYKVNVQGEADAKTVVRVDLDYNSVGKEFTFYGTKDESDSVDWSEYSHNYYDDYDY